MKPEIRKRIRTLVYDVSGYRRAFNAEEDPKTFFDPDHYKLFCALSAEEFELESRSIVVDFQSFREMTEYLIDRFSVN